MTLEDWLAAAEHDARRRGLPALVPLLGTLARATRSLRDAEWNQQATRQEPEPRPPREPSSP